MTSDRILGAMAIVLAGAMALASWSYAAPVAYEPVGPRAFPLLLAGLMAACGGWLVLRPRHDAGFPIGAARLHMALFGGVVLVYAILFQLLGCVLATALMALPVGRLFGGSWRQSAWFGATLGVALFVLFDVLLDVVLPAGILKPVFTAMDF